MQFQSSFRGFWRQQGNLGSFFSMQESTVENRLSSYSPRSLTLVTSAGDGPDSGGLEASWR